MTIDYSALPTSLSILQAIGIGTISRRWISTTALNAEYTERKQQQEKMLEDEQVILLSSDVRAMQGQARVACQAATEFARRSHVSNLCHLQVGQICSDAWKRKGVNNSEKLFNICVNTPSGKSTFVKAVPTDGSVAITADFIKELLVTSALEVHSLPLEGSLQHKHAGRSCLDCNLLHSKHMLI